MKYAAIFRADELASHRAMKPAIDVLNLAVGMSRPGIQERIKSCDLTNPNLVWMLGYIAGFIDAAHQRGKSGDYSEMLVDGYYLDAVKMHLSELEGAGVYLRVVEQERRKPGSHLSLLQRGVPKFKQGMSFGGGDYVNFVNDRKMPMSLALYLTDQLAERDGS